MRNGLWAILAIRMCTDLNFEFPPEIVNHWGIFRILISTLYDLGHTNSNFEYYLGWIVCKLGHRNCLVGAKFPSCTVTQTHNENDWITTFLFFYSKQSTTLSIRVYRDIFKRQLWLLIIYVTLDHKTSLKSLGYICSYSQKYTVWVKIIDFSFMPKIIRTLNKDHVPWRYFVNFLL